MRRIIVLVALGCGGSSKPQATTTAPVTPFTVAPHRDVTAPTSSTSPPAPPPGEVRVPGSGNRCDMVPIADLSIDGLLDDWGDKHVLTRAGSPADGAIEVRCAWDGTAI